jgi:hypothetical protein
MNKEEPHNHKRQHNSDHLERLLLEGINSGPATEMTRDDWTGIMEEAKLLVAQRKARKDQS